MLSTSKIDFERARKHEDDSGSSYYFSDDFNKKRHNTTLHQRDIKKMRVEKESTSDGGVEIQNMIQEVATFLSLHCSPFGSYSNGKQAIERVDQFTKGLTEGRDHRSAGATLPSNLLDRWFTQWRPQLEKLKQEVGFWPCIMIYNFLFHIFEIFC